MDLCLNIGTVSYSHGLPGTLPRGWKRVDTKSVFVEKMKSKKDQTIRLTSYTDVIKT